MVNSQALAEIPTWGSSSLGRMVICHTPSMGVSETRGMLLPGLTELQGLGFKGLVTKWSGRYGCPVPLVAVWHFPTTMCLLPYIAWDVTPYSDSPCSDGNWGYYDPF